LLNRAKTHLQTIISGRDAFSLTLIFILIEFFDELHYAVDGAVLPAIRADLSLSYAQIGLLLGLPHVAGTIIEPILLILGDTSLRKSLIAGGGLMVMAALLVISGAAAFPVLLAGFMINFPASGAFVTLSQATLMDRHPGREAHMMARWTVAGSLGNLVGPLLVAATLGLELNWRWIFAGLALLALMLAGSVFRQKFPSLNTSHKKLGVATENLARAFWRLLHTRSLLRWILLLQLSDLLLDVYIGYVALYFTDITAATPTQASLLLSALMATGLIMDLALIPLLERFPGRWIVRTSAAASIPVFTAWLLVPWLWVKIILAIMIRVSTLGWYQVLQGETYASVPGNSGTVMAISSLAGLAGGLMTWFIGWFAGLAGLSTAMWLLLAGPISLVLLVPVPQKPEKMTAGSR
jgi:FSR family fosmidomycin resistance protein-like MFS transporter